MLELAGVPDLVARDRDDYVAIAARIACDRAARDEIAARIREGRARVFDDAAPTAALADALDEIATG